MKNILLGITSSISAYKANELVRLCKKNGFNVKVILSENALNFVSPLVLETLSENKVYYKQEHKNSTGKDDFYVLLPELWQPPRG